METGAEVLILGGGVAGCAAALALVQAGVGPLTLLDRPLAAPFPIGESATPDVPLSLEKLGLSGDLAAQGHRPHHATLASWGCKLVFNEFLARGMGPGWHLDRARFNAGLRHAAQERIVDGGGTVETQTQPIRIERHRQAWRVDLGSQGTVTARFLIDAGGRAAPLARRLRVRRHRFDRQIALAVLAPEAGAALSGISLVETEALGWWYAAPLPQGGAIVALMTDDDVARDHRLRDPDVFLERWRATKVLAERVAPPTAVSRPHAFAAHGVCLSRAAGPGWAAVGDALIGSDPLTSSGIAAALSDALAAAQLIVAELSGAGPQAAIAYAQRANRAVNRFLSDRQALWQAETAWRASPYWNRRRMDPGPCQAGSMPCS